jgi:hypothetical protein
MFAHTGIRDFAALLLATALVWSQGCSEPTPADPNAGMRDIYSLSDLSGRIRSILDYANEALAKQRAQFTEEQLEIAKQVIREQFASERLGRRVLEFLEKRAEREYLDETLEWLETPLGEKIMRVKIASYSPADPAEMASFIEETRADPPSQKRLDLIERYDAAAHLSRMTSETVLLSAYGVAVMADSLKPEAERRGPKALQTSMISKRALLKPIFKETSAVASLFTFRDLSDEELETFVIFSESEAGRWYHETTSSVFLGTLFETTANLGSALVAALPAQPSSRTVP